METICSKNVIRTTTKANTQHLKLPLFIPLQKWNRVVRPSFFGPLQIWATRYSNSASRIARNCKVGRSERWATVSWEPRKLLPNFELCQSSLFRAWLSLSFFFCTRPFTFPPFSHPPIITAGTRSIAIALLKYCVVFLLYDESFVVVVKKKTGFSQQ